MDAHGVQVLNGADDHHIIISVPHHFKLEFLPADYRFFQHDLMNQAGIEPPGRQPFKVLAIVGHTAASATQGKARTHYNRIADPVCNLTGAFHVHDNPAFWHAESNTRHGFSEQVPVFSFLDHLGRCPDHLDLEPIQHTHFSHLDCRI